MDFCCAICMESFGSSCDIATIPCGHVFHEPCIKKWHNAHKNCGQCRQECKSEEISKLFISETENALKEKDLSIKYEEIILNLNKEIHKLKSDKLEIGEKIELKKEILRLKAENVKLEKENHEFLRSQTRCCEINEDYHSDNIKLSKKLQDLKFHEIKVQKMLKDKIDAANSKLSDIKYDLKMQIAETNKAKREIIALEAKCVPSDQIPRRKNKRKSENGELQSNSAKSKSPPQKKSKQTVEKQPTAEHNAKVVKSLDKVPTPTLVPLSPTLPVYTPTSPVYTPTSPADSIIPEFSALVDSISSSREISELLESLSPSRSPSPDPSPSYVITLE